MAYLLAWILAALGSLTPVYLSISAEDIVLIPLFVIINVLILLVALSIYFFEKIEYMSGVILFNQAAYITAHVIMSHSTGSLFTTYIAGWILQFGAACILGFITSLLYLLHAEFKEEPIL